MDHDDSTLGLRRLEAALERRFSPPEPPARRLGAPDHRRGRAPRRRRCNHWRRHVRACRRLRTPSPRHLQHPPYRPSPRWAGGSVADLCPDAHTALAQAPDRACSGNGEPDVPGLVRGAGPGLGCARAHHDRRLDGVSRLVPPRDRRARRERHLAGCHLPAFRSCRPDTERRRAGDGPARRAGNGTRGSGHAAHPRAFPAVLWDRGPAQLR